MHPILFPIAAFVLGYLFPEWMGCLSRREVEFPIGHNIASGFGFALLAAAFVIK